MRITWLGQACFHIAVSDGTQIAMDPYNDGIGYPPLRLDADIVSISHGHGDHNNLSAITGEYTLLDKAGAWQVTGVSVRGVDTFHDDEGGKLRGGNIVYVYTLEGLNICHCGDLGHVPTHEQRVKIGHVDILLIPVGGYYTMPLNEVTQTIDLLKPAITIPMHYRVNDNIKVIAPVDDFLATVPQYQRIDNSMDITTANIGAFNPVVVLTP